MRATTHRLCVRTAQPTASWRCSNPFANSRRPRKTFLKIAIRASVPALLLSPSRPVDGEMDICFQAGAVEIYIIIADRLWQAECLGGSLPATGELGFGEQGRKCKEVLDEGRVDR
jgi:hypothetical protein